MDVHFKGFRCRRPAADVFLCSAPRCNEHTDGIFPSDAAFGCNLQPFIMWRTVAPTHTHTILHWFPSCAPCWCSGFTSFSLNLPSGCKACPAYREREETSSHAGARSPARCSFSSPGLFLVGCMVFVAKTHLK